MKITLLYFDECPNWQEGEVVLRRFQDRNPGVEIGYEIVETPQEAVACGFFGSPSFQVDGVDLFPSIDLAPALACRIYQTPSGPGGAPTLEQLEEAAARYESERA